MTLPLLYIEIFFEKIYELHAMKRGHQGFAIFVISCFMGQYHVLWAQQKKEAVEVEHNVRKHWFGYFGLPLILQSDNGSEFKNKIMVRSIYEWQGSCEVVFGRPRHPQSQGLVEQANGTVEKMLTKLLGMILL